MNMFAAILVSATIALLWAGILYWRNKKDELPSVWRAVSGCLRFGFVFFLCFLLFSPLFKMQRQEESKPLCFLALDRSASMTENSAYLLKETEKLSARLEKNFRVIETGFAANAGKGFEAVDSQSTHYENLFSFIKNEAENQPNACAVIISDGNVNSGQEPVYGYRSCALPLFTVAAGDTAVYPDLYIGQVQHNPYGYKANTFPVRVHIGKTLIDKAPTVLRLSYKGTVIKEEKIDAASVQEVEFEIGAPEAGVFRYTLSLEPVKGERNLENNRAGFTVKILESRRKVLVLAAAPHPDLGALKESLLRSGKYEVDVQLISKPDPSGWGAADIVILHGLKENPLPDKPAGYILTKAESVSGMKIIPQGNGFNEAGITVNERFPLFEIKENEKNLYKKLPPLYAPFAKYEAEGGQVLFYQNILQTATGLPLVWININAPQPVFVICGSGLWRWPLAEYKINRNTEIFDLFTDRLVQLLSTEKNKENLVIRCPQVLASSQNLTVRAELYNATREKTPGKEIRFELVNETTAAQYTYNFLPDADDYILEAGALPDGDYTYTATAVNGNEEYKTKGKIIIEPFRLENAEMPANTALLRNLALTYNGEFFYAGTGRQPQSDCWNNLYKTLCNRKDLKPVLREKETYVSLLDKTAFLVLLLCMLCTEFLFRKIFGNI